MRMPTVCCSPSSACNGLPLQGVAIRDVSVDVAATGELLTSVAVLVVIGLRSADVVGVST